MVCCKTSSCWTITWATIAASAPITCSPRCWRPAAGAYQILYLDKVPDYAAVNQAVELARLFKRGSAAGLVNAVLRKVSQNKHALPPIPEGDILRTLSIRYSHPRWLIKRLLPVLGPEETEEYLRINNSVSPMTVQVNTMKTTLQALRAQLEEAGIAVREHLWVPGCLELSGTGDLTALPASREGLFLVQDRRPVWCPWPHR